MKKLLFELQELFVSNKFHERIKYLRKVRNLTIKQAADKCIITEKCWSDWENGKAIPRKKNRRIIARALNVSEEMIFGNPKACIF